MSLTRRMLKAMGIDEEKIDEIIEAHAETVEALKKERDDARSSATEADGLREQLKAAQDALEAAKDDDGLQARLDALQQEYDGYREQVEAEKQQAEKRRLYSDVLRAAGVDERRIGAVLRVTDLDAVKVEDGSIVGRDELVEKLRGEWADFIPQTSTHGADVPDPPKSLSGGFDSMSLTEKMRYANEHPNDPDVGAWLGHK